MRPIKVILICCAALIAGCNYFRQPGPDEPHATIVAKPGPNEFMSGGSQIYMTYFDAKCQNTGETGVLGNLSYSNPDKNRFTTPAGKRVYLYALSQGIRERESADQPITARSCWSISSFIPVVGATYQATHSAPRYGCALELIDQKTGIAPPSLIVEQPSYECRQR
jgi:hypothetical protein